jgi:hypothetical protein
MSPLVHRCTSGYQEARVETGLVVMARLYSRSSRLAARLVVNHPEPALSLQKHPLKNSEEP